MGKGGGFTAFTFAFSLGNDRAVGVLESGTV